MTAHDDDQVREARDTIAADQARQDLENGTMTFTDFAPDEAEQILAVLPPADLDATTVPTSIRLPYPLHQRLRAYAEARGTTASTLIRDWIEQMLAVPDRPISLADAVRALSTLPPRDDQPGSAARPAA